MGAARRQPAPGADVRLLACGALAGALGVLWFGILPPQPWVMALLALPALRAPPAWRELLTGCALAAAWVGLHAQAALADRWPPERHHHDVELVARIADFPRPAQARLRLLLEPVAPGHPRRIQASWYEPPPELSLRPGDCGIWQLRMRTPSASVNPGGFDYEGWLWREGIGALATVRGWQPCRDGAQAASLDRLRGALSDRIAAVAGHSPAGGVLRALLVGDRSGIPPALWDVFRHTGTSHLMAISGLHVGLLAAIAGWLSLRLLLLAPWPVANPPRIAAAVAVLAAAIYAALAGFALPTLRALCMLCALVLAWTTGRRAASGAVLASAALVVMLLDPFAVLRPGFWLSFAAVAVILWIVAGGRRGAFGGALRVQWALGLALAPLTALAFGGFSPVGLFVNLVAVPAMAVLLPLLALGTAAALAAPGIGDVLLDVGMWALAASLDGLKAAAQWPVAWVGLSLTPAQALLLAMAVALLALRPLPLGGLAAACAVAGLLPPPAPRPGELELAVLDVGQGTAVVARTASGTLLYDAGPAWSGSFDAGRQIVEPYLRRAGIRRLDRVILSHGDRDHAGGAEYLHAAGWLARPPAAVTGCVAGERWIWSGVAFETLHPPAPGARGNAGSCVLRIDTGRWRVLLTGDIPRRVEQALIVRGVDLRADIVLSPHHGSRSSSSPALIRATGAAWVVHSAGWRQRYHHPHPSVVRRWQAAGATQLVTGRDGAVLFRLRPDAMELKLGRHVDRRLWRRPPLP